MKFKDNEHKRLFDELCKTREYIDEYHAALFYLITLDTVCREHIKEIYSAETDGINPESLHKGWQTGTSRKTTRLAFNLWNGYNTDGETYIDKQGREQDIISPYYVIDEIFACNYAPYYWQAIKLRYPEYTNE